MTNVVISSAARTAVGSYGKSLKDVPPTELGRIAAVAALERARTAPEHVETVVFGNVIHSEAKDMYMARVVGVNAGIPTDTPAFTVNRLCGTGVQAIVSATQAIQTGEARVALAGGAESMSRGPYWLPEARWGAKMGPSKMVDPVMGGLTDPFHEILMGVTAENLAERHSITRERQDAFAVLSHARASRAQGDGIFDEQIVPVGVRVKRDTVDFVTDEHIRHGADAAGMAKLPTVFKKEGGTVTAGNASGMNDAGAAVVLMDEERARELGAPARARILSYASCGVDPRFMGIGPVPAIQKVLARTGVALEDIGVIELNEAFAIQVLSLLDHFGIDDDDPRVNPWGGAIAIGHPLASSGVRLMIQLARQFEEHPEVRYGLTAMCVGLGQGGSVIWENPHFDRKAIKKGKK